MLVLFLIKTSVVQLLELLQNVQNSDLANSFYKTFFVVYGRLPFVFAWLLTCADVRSLLQDLLGVLTDTFHKPGTGLLVL